MKKKSKSRKSFFASKKNSLILSLFISSAFWVLDAQMHTNQTLNACLDFGESFRALFNTDELNTPHFTEALKIELCELAIKALQVSFTVAFMMPTENGRKLACRVHADKQRIEEDILKQREMIKKHPVFSGAFDTARRLNAATMQRIYKFPSFHSASEEGFMLLILSEELSLVEFDYSRDTKLKLQLHILAKQAFKVGAKLLKMAGRCLEVQYRLMSADDIDHLTDSLLAPPIIVEANGYQKVAILDGNEEGRYAFVMLHPVQSNLCLGFVIINEHIVRPATSGTVFIEQIEIHPSFRRQGLGRMLLNWLKQTGSRNGYDSLWVNRSSLLDTQAFWRKMGFVDFDQEWLIHGPMRMNEVLLSKA